MASFDIGSIIHHTAVWSSVIATIIAIIGAFAFLFYIRTFRIKAHIYRYTGNPPSLSYWRTDRIRINQSKDGIFTWRFLWKRKAIPPIEDYESHLILNNKGKEMMHMIESNGEYFALSPPNMHRKNWEIVPQNNLDWHLERQMRNINRNETVNKFLQYAPVFLVFVALVISLVMVIVAIDYVSGLNVQCSAEAIKQTMPDILGIK